MNTNYQELKNAKAALFDFDGTVTEKGNYDPTDEVVRDIISLGLKMPVGFCTGRQLESFMKRGFVVFDRILNSMPSEVRTTFLNNFHLMAENGAIGYKFDQKFEEFYRVPWPEEKYARLKFMKEIEEEISDLGDVFNNAHRIVTVLRTRVHNDPERDTSEMYRLSSEIYERVIAFLEKYDKDFEKYFHVGNSGIGVVISPADGDKNRGIKEFAELLKAERGIDFAKNYPEVIAIGDRPQKCGNDHYFLNGEFGTPFTVGDVIEDSPFPKLVINKDGKRLMHSKGTQFLIRKILDFKG